MNLKSSRFNEADKLMTFFTKKCGKVKAVAKSACKTGSKFGGRLELLSYNNILLAKGKNLDILSQIETIETFHTIRESEQKLQAGMYIAKVLYHFLEETSCNEPLFDATLDCLYMLKAGISPSVVTRIFDIRLADMEGFLPMSEFSSQVRPCVTYLREGNFDSNKFTASDLRDIDIVLMPRMSDHIGKDIRTWKSM